MLLSPMREILGHYREEGLEERGVARFRQHMVLQLVHLVNQTGLLLLAVLGGEELVKTLQIEVLPAFEC